MIRYLFMALLCAAGVILQALLLPAMIKDPGAAMAGAVGGGCWLASLWYWFSEWRGSRK